MVMRLVRCVWVVTASLSTLSFSSVGIAETPPLTRAMAKPGDVGMDAEVLDRIEPVIQEAITQGDLPGCVIAVSRQGKTIYHRAFGNRQVKPTIEPMTTDTVFDLASLTKPIATATSVMKLIEQHQFERDDRVAELMPEFGTHGKDKITIEDLLIHQAGLTPDNPIGDYRNGPELAWQRICELKLLEPVGTRFRYSDVNFIVLAELVHRTSGMNVNEFSQHHFFTPLGMTETGYLPTASLRSRAAPQDRDGDRWIKGEVHDPRARLLGGVAGHAGLFSTADDLLIFAQMLLGQGTLDQAVVNDSALAESLQQPVQVLMPTTIAMMTADYPVSSGIRGLGWDKKTGYSSNKGSRLSGAAFGHGGFTGTVFWVDPAKELAFVFLSNRLHPDGQGKVNRLSGVVLDLVSESIQTQR